MNSLRAFCFWAVASIVCLMPVSAIAGGPFDGIWSITYNGTHISWFSINENNGNLIVFGVQGDNVWDGFFGARTGDTANLNTTIGTVSATMMITFTSPTTLTVTQKSCIAKTAECAFPNGTVYQGTKIW